MVVDELNAADIPFMLVGSNAAYLHGAERSTVDIDILINRHTNPWPGSSLPSSQPTSTSDRPRMRRWIDVISST